MPRGDIRLSHAVRATSISTFHHQGLIPDMKQLLPVTLSVAFLASAAGTVVNAADFSAVPSGTYHVDPTHAYIHMQYSHLGLSNPILGFEEFKVSMDLDNADPTKTSVAVEIDVDSVRTGSEVFHEHLTGEKWFDVANNPTISFASTGISANADGTYALTGDLTIKDQTNPVTLTVTVNNATMHPFSKKPVVGISAVGGLKRSQWGLGANAPYVSDDVKLEIQAELLQAE
jgi:polyisoprenoid-binding protein YceI